MSDTPDLTPEAANQLIIDSDGDACINDDREFDLVALPARHDNGDILNPFEWEEMVRRFNDWPALSAALAIEQDRADKAEAERDALAGKLATARDDALEEAAQVAERCDVYSSAALRQRIASAIRAMKGNGNE